MPLSERSRKGSALIAAASQLQNIKPSSLARIANDSNSPGSMFSWLIAGSLVRTSLISSGEAESSFTRPLETYCCCMSTECFSSLLLKNLTYPMTVEAAKISWLLASLSKMSNDNRSIITSASRSHNFNTVTFQFHEACLFNKVVDLAPVDTDHLSEFSS